MRSSNHMRVMLLATALIATNEVTVVATRYDSKPIRPKLFDAPQRQDKHWYKKFDKHAKKRFR
jgi:hypothetical protein